MIQVFSVILVAFATTYWSTPVLASKLAARGITGIDVHKLTKPIRPEMGGLAVVSGLAAAFLIGYVFDSRLLLSVAPAILTIGLVATVGALDDLIHLKQRYKPFLVAAASLPLVLSYQGDEAIWFPGVGLLEFGILYTFLVIPLMVTSLSNFANMNAGFNGLEAGMATIGLVTLGVSCFITGTYAPGLVAIILGVSYAGFLPHNWFPARVFLGDTGTLTAGAAIAVIGITANLEYVALLVSVPAAFDFTLKLLSVPPFGQRKIHGDSSVTESGILVPAAYPSLSHAFMRVTQLSEKRLVIVILLMEALYAAIALGLVASFKLGYVI